MCEKPPTPAEIELAQEISHPEQVQARELKRIAKALEGLLLEVKDFHNSFVEAAQR